MSEPTWHSEKIETITNENGTAIKFPDGTMICVGNRKILENITTIDGALYRTTDRVSLGTFPIPFKETPKVSLTVVGSAVIIGNLYMTTTTDIGKIYAYRPTAYTNIKLDIDFIAIGRWK